METDRANPHAKTVSGTAPGATPIRKERIDQLVGDHARKLSERLQAHRDQLYPPNAQKVLRKFTSGEAAAMIGVTDAYLRKLDLDGKGPSPEVRGAGRRFYSTADIQAVREMLEAGAKTEGAYLPGRREGDALQVITVINFKGGSGKTTTAAHLAQKAALDGYRVLAIDLDPQASFSALHGFQPEFDLLDGGTLYDAITYDNPCPLSDVIRKSYFTNLDIIPGNLDLMEFEHETPAAITQGDGRFFFTRVGDALATVEDRYDIVVIDCPPQLGFLTMSALSAATSVLVTVLLFHPQSFATSISPSSSGRWRRSPERKSPWSIRMRKRLIPGCSLALSPVTTSAPIWISIWCVWPGKRARGSSSNAPSASIQRPRRSN